MQGLEVNLFDSVPSSCFSDLQQNIKYIYIPQDKGYRLQVSDLECQPQTHVIPNNSNPMCINQFVVIPDNHKNYFFLALQRIGIPFREHLFFNLFE